jgi:hypothetical protein
MTPSKRWISLGFLLLVVCFFVVAHAQNDRPSPEWIYDVLIVHAPPPSGLTDNRPNHERLANELARLLNAKAVDGWQPVHMWGTEPIYFVMKRSKK